MSGGCASPRSPAVLAGIAIVLAALVAGCGQQVQPPAPQPEQVVPAAPPAPSAVQASRAQTSATMPPGVALAVQIQQALRRTTWPAAFDAETVPGGTPEWQQGRCLDVGPRNATRCTFGRTSTRRSVALLGDSVAIGWLPAMRRAASLRDARIHVLTRRQCANLRGFGTPSCAAHQDWALEQVRRLRPDLVLLSARYQGGQTWAQWQAGTKRLLAELRPYAKRTIVLAPPPDSVDVRACYQRGLAPADCAVPVTASWRSYAYAEWKAAANQARFLDPRPWFCVAERCPGLVGGVPVTFDGRHLTGAYAVRLAPVLSVALR